VCTYEGMYVCMCVRISEAINSLEIKGDGALFPIAQYESNSLVTDDVTRQNDVTTVT